MPAFLIAYDLAAPASTEKYERVIGLIKKWFTTHLHFEQSCWIVVSDLSADAIFDTVSPACQSSDKLLVFALGKDVQCSLHPESNSTWLKEHVLGLAG